MSDTQNDDADQLETAVETFAERRKRANDLMRELLIERPLYAKVEGGEALMDAIDDVITPKMEVALEFDLYCMWCGVVTPWTVQPCLYRSSGGGAGSRYSGTAPVPSIRALNAVCLRKRHFYTYVLLRKNDFVQKIGQTPSMADIAHGELKGIPGINSRDRKELGRALGLFAHETPLGAFVYLRRVFERMVERAHEYHIESKGAPIEN
jgi:hypothetical protein